jgi:hypothetical protein
LRVSIVAGIVALLAVGVGFVKGERLPTGPENGLLQTTPGYNPPDDSATDTGDGYNPPATDSPDANATPEDITPSPEFTATITLTATLAPDVFRTEDSEIDQSKTTPMVTETPGPTNTVYITPTGARTLRAPTPTSGRPKEKDAFVLDWGMFLAGFSLPVLAACGYVLYLMDRHPELFRRPRR